MKNVTDIFKKSDEGDFLLIMRPDCFISEHIKIKSPYEGIIPFQMYPYQFELIESFEDYTNNIVLKARQIGMTTLLAAYTLHMVITKPHIRARVVVPNRRMCDYWATMFENMITSLSDRFVGKIYEKDSALHRTSLLFPNMKSVIDITTSAITSDDPEPIKLLIIDEADFIDNMDELMSHLESAVSNYGKIIAYSSLSESENTWFKNTWKGAQIDSKTWKSKKIAWFDVPHYTAERRNAYNFSHEEDVAKRELDCELV